MMRSRGHWLDQSESRGFIALSTVCKVASHNQIFTFHRAKSTISWFKIVARMELNPLNKQKKKRTVNKLGK